MKQHIFLGASYLGARDIPTWSDIGEISKPSNSYALFCPICAEVWGKLMHEHKEAYCQVVTSHCLRHAIFPSDATFTSSSPWLGDPRGYDGSPWPREALIHDVIALTTFLLNHKDRYPYDPR